MKRLIAGLLIAMCSAGLARAGEAEGFRDITWGSSIAGLQGFTKVTDAENEPGVETYRRAKDSMKVGAATASRIDYKFFQGRFCGVAVFVLGETDWTLLKESVFEKYGSLLQPNEFMDDYIKTGKTTIVFLTYSQIVGGGVFDLRSRAIDKEIKKYTKQIGREGF